jgi:hypothetical protein
VTAIAAELGIVFPELLLESNEFYMIGTGPPPAEAFHPPSQATATSFS